MIEKPKKERRFLKTLGKIGEILIQEVLIKIGSNLIKKIGGKKTLPSILFLLASLSLFAQYPATGNKQRLGYQTTGDGLLFRGRANDTMALKPSTINNAYFILDTVNNVLFNYIKTKGGWQFSNGDTIIINNNFTQPVDSLFFNVGVPTNNVDTAKMRWDSDLATVVLGLNDNVPNELGFKNFWLVKNQTGATITKGSLVYANGTLGASGRITVAKFIANGSIDAKYLLGITAHDLTNGEDGYVISFGKIRQVNTDTFTAGAILYPSPTTAGVWTDVEPVAPNIDMPIGFCINSHVNNGTIAIRVASGYKLHELHDLAISSPIDKASLYYKSSEGLWRDTTAALLLSDTASMLIPYFKDSDTTSLNLTSRFAAKLNISDTASMLIPYFKDSDTTSLNLTSRFAAKLNISDTASMLIPYFKDSDTTSLNLTSRFAAKLNVSDTASMLTNYLRSGIAASTYQANLNGTGFVKASGTTISYDNSTYLTTGTAASTYLPLTGGTLSNTQNNTLTINSVAANFNPNIALVSSASSPGYHNTNIGVRGVGQTIYSAGIGLQGEATQTDMNGFGSAFGIQGIVNGTGAGGNGSTYGGYFTNTTTVAGNNYGLYVTTASGGDYGIYQTGTGTNYFGSNTSFAGTLSATTGTFTSLNTNNSSDAIIGLQPGDNNMASRIQFNNFGIIRQEIVKPSSTGNLQFRSYPTGTATGGYEFYVSNGSAESLAAIIGTDKSLSLTGTLGVTGATTLSAPLTVNSSAVFNEGSTDSDFRVESDANVNMVFVDASTDRVGIGTNAPTKTLDVNGDVRIVTTTTPPTSLLGKDDSNVVGTVTTLAQTGLMKAGGTTTNTSSVGIITVAHGLSYTPTQVLVTLAQQNSYVIVCHGINSTNLLFTVYDSVTGNALNNVSVGFFWLAIK